MHLADANQTFSLSSKYLPAAPAFQPSSARLIGQAKRTRIRAIRFRYRLGSNVMPVLIEFSVRICFGNPLLPIYKLRLGAPIVRHRYSVAGDEGRHPL